MAMSMKDFLLAYYKQLHFDAMSPEVRARFDDYKQNKDFSGDMKDWADNLDGKSLPDANIELNDEDWNKLFNAFNTALGRMFQDADGLAENKAAREFVAEYYGAGKLFSIEPVDGSTETEINELKTNLAHLKGAIQNFLPEDASFEQFEKNLNSGKYNSDEKFRKIFLSIIDRLDTAKQWGLQGASPEAVAALNAIDTAKIAAGFEQKPNPGKLTSFKQEYKSILNALHNKAKLREMFSQYDDGKISKPLNKALNKVAYDNKDSKSYLHPKSEDELNLLQRVQEWASDTYENHLDKYTKLRGDRMFFSMPAQMICKGIDNAKIKPTDGIAAILDNADKIKKSMQYKSPAAIKHFDWFIKEMNVLKDAMPKAFEGGLRNGPQLRRLIEKLIVDAIDEGKTKEAKTAMEILSVVKYANTTSKIMDTIKNDKELFNLMSNKDLSWNKNAGVQFVTSALDKSVRAAFIGLGYGATMAINGIRKSRSKITRPGKLLNEAYENWRIDTNKELVETQQINHNAENRKQQQWQTVHNARRHGVIEQDLQNYSTAFQTLDTNIKIGLDSLEQFVEQQTGGQPTQDPDIIAIQNYIQTVQQYMQNAQSPQNPAQAPSAPVLSGTGQAYQQIVNTLTQILPNWFTQLQGQKSKQSEFDNLNSAIAELRAANNQIAETKKKLANWDDNHKDQYADLIKYWNRLETGRDSHMGEMYSWRPGSKKAKQEAFWAQQGGRGI